MAVSWRPDQLDPPRPVSAPLGRAARHQAVQSSRRRKRTRDRAGASRGKIAGTMAHATKCTAPEGNRGRDEWTTVIEMQEYIRARREDLRYALMDGGTAPLNQVRTDKGKLRVVIASQLRRSILVFRNLEEAANLFQGHYQQRFHPVPLLHSPPAHAIRLLVAH